MSEPSDVWWALRSLPAVRETASLLLEHPAALSHFDVDKAALDAVVERVLALIARDYASAAAIPFHSRWRHFDSPGAPRIQNLMDSWTCSSVEKVRRIVDLFVVSVLLDAGAGNSWSFRSWDGTVSARSEGLALASLDWFLSGGLSSGPPMQPHRVDSVALRTRVTCDTLAAAFQVSADTNPLVGVEGRCKLLNRLGTVLEAQPHYFFHRGNNDFRPGNMVDHILYQRTPGGHDVSVELLWEVVMNALFSVWPPTRTTVDGLSVGDVWPCKAIETIVSAPDAEESVPKIPRLAAEKGVYVVAFHKLSQWLTYSLMEPLSLLEIKFTDMGLMTGLAEYRNGGLFVDMNVLKLKPATLARGLAQSAVPGIPRFEVHDDAVVEWRGLTVALLDVVGERVRAALNMSEDELPLVKVLEAGTWKLGREVAAELRPETKGPPIDIVSDGTVF
ncbi:hypothetical protein HDU83_000617 [Entophlyctis luteolus]|nr:hypothetical protein HDU83_000617 [Entophlyctis luteolus]